MGHRVDRVSRRERAATLVEYVLLVAVLALGTLAGISFMEDGAERATSNTAAKISTRSVPSVPTGGGGGITPTTTTTPPTTTTTTTKPPATTTTVKPTTTTTTTTQPPVVSTTWGATGKQTRSGEWKATAKLTVTRGSGQPVSGATVTVRVEYAVPFIGYVTSEELSATTTSAGSLTFESGWFPSGGWIPINSVRFTVISVTAPSSTWDGTQQSVVVNR